MDLPELIDRIEIAETLSRYCDFVDRSDIVSLVGLFTDDILMDMGNGATASGRERLRPLLIDRVGRWRTTNHHCSNVILRRYDAGSASVTSYLYAFHDDPARNESMHLWGRYEDELVKVQGAWRFRIRRLRVAGVQQGESRPVPERFERFARLPLPTS